MNSVQTVQINDVLSGRGNGPNLHSGNIVFRRTVALKSDAYNRSSCSCEDKRKIIEEVVGQITSNEGRFLSKMDENGLRRILDLKETKLKTAQALRDSKNNDATDDEISTNQHDIGLSPECNLLREQPMNNDTTNEQTCNLQDIFMESTNNIHHGKSFNWETLKNSIGNSLDDSIVDALMASRVSMSMSINAFPGLQIPDELYNEAKDVSDQPWSTSFALNRFKESQDTHGNQSPQSGELKSDTHPTNRKCRSESESGPALNYINFLDEHNIVNKKSSDQCHYPTHITNFRNEDVKECNNVPALYPGHSYLTSKSVQLMRRSILSLNGLLTQSQRNLVLNEDEGGESDDTKPTMNARNKIVAPNHQIKSDHDQTWSTSVDYSYAACNDINEMSLSYSHIQKALKSEKEDYSVCVNGNISDFSSDDEYVYDDKIDNASHDTYKFCSDMRDD